MPPTSARSRSRLHLLAGLLLLVATGCAGRSELALVPVPAHIQLHGDDPFIVDTTALISVLSGGEAELRIARELAEIVGTTAESRPRIVAGADHAADADIILAVDAAATARYGPEGYALRVTGAGVRIDAAAPAGLFYGVQTLRQLLPPRIEYGAARPATLSLPRLEIEDAPRFPWRGAMLDVSRHFFGVDDVKRYIDLMALHKLNRLHLHLSDDQGWRVEVPGWPRLTEHGGSTQVGGGPGGYYTSEEYAELARYAAERFITLVPEIDMPGHTNAALASVPDLNCDGVAPDLYTGIEVGFSALCVDKEFTYEFIDAVIAHLAALTPGPWIHVGGDEVEELTDAEYRRFIERVEVIVHRHGKRMVGWQEIAPAAIHPSTLIQHWHGDGRELLGAHAGQVILSPASRAYVDMKYHEGTPIGLSWAGLTPLRDAYDWEPTRLVPGLPANAIAGIEAPLWTETLATVADLEFMAFPRLAAIAELAWSPAEALGWKSFRRRLGPMGLRWTALGVNYYRSPEVDWMVW